METKINYSSDKLIKTMTRIKIAEIPFGFTINKSAYNQQASSDSMDILYSFAD